MFRAGVCALSFMAIGLWLAAAAPARADECGPAPAPDAALLAAPDVREARSEARQNFANASGRLYRIDTEPPSYLVGTFHLGGAGLGEPGPLIEEMVDGASAVLLELDEKTVQISIGEMALNPSRILRKDGRKFTDQMDAGERDRARKILAEFNLTLDEAELLRPGFIAALLSLPPCVSNAWPPIPGLDVRIEYLARERDIPAYALETIDEQFEALLGDDDSKGDRLLRAFLPYADASADMLHVLRALYRGGEVAAIWTLAMNKVDDVIGEAERNQLAAEIWDDLVVKRNRRMLERAMPYLERGGAVIAVGALHLVGKEGLVELLREAGFTVTAIPDG
ncbi:MAG: TraB/GumN family protein [Pseudomonadota bacterium]